MATPRHPLGDSMEANMHRRVEPSNLASAVDVTTPVGTSVAQQSGQIKKTKSFFKTSMKILYRTMMSQRKHSRVPNNRGLGINM